MPPEPDHYQQRREQFVFLREIVLLGIGSIGLLTTLVAILLKIIDSGVAITALGTFAVMCGLPTWFQVDERRARNDK